jgi:hypothetical protein
MVQEVRLAEMTLMFMLVEALNLLVHLMQVAAAVAVAPLVKQVD